LSPKQPRADLELAGLQFGEQAIKQPVLGVLGLSCLLAVSPVHFASALEYVAAAHCGGTSGKEQNFAPVRDGPLRLLLAKDSPQPQIFAPRFERTVGAAERVDCLVGVES
jgi:hypothetical protein